MTMDEKEKELLKDGLMILIEEACDREDLDIICNKEDVSCKPCEQITGCIYGIIADHLIEAGVTLPENWLAERDKKS